jgi:hypothetical protein
MVSSKALLRKEKEKKKDAEKHGSSIAKYEFPFSFV